MLFARTLHKFAGLKKFSGMPLLPGLHERKRFTAGKSTAMRSSALQRRSLTARETENLL
jgi:hypothetical protein